MMSARVTPLAARVDVGMDVVRTRQSAVSMTTAMGAAHASLRIALEGRSISAQFWTRAVLRAASASLGASELDAILTVHK